MMNDIRYGCAVLDIAVTAIRLHLKRYKFLRVSEILPANPICDDEIDQHRDDQNRKVFVVGIIGEDIQNLQ